MYYTNESKQADIWRTCNKMRAATFRMGINLFEYFTPLDPNKTCLISESQFISVLNSQFRDTIGLTEQEIAELADYFRVPDGRIYYTQLCQVIHDAIPDTGQNIPRTISSNNVTDKPCGNILSVKEERRVNVLITKISSIVNTKRLLLFPYFQDYELVSKSNGLITIAHFARVLDFLKIPLAPAEFNLLVKKFVTNSYTLNYVAFINSIMAVKDYMQKHRILDLSGDIVKIFPGKVPKFEFPKLPRPQFTYAVASHIFGNNNTLNPDLKDPKKIEHILNTLSNIQDHVSRYKMRVARFFENFDPLKCGKVTVSQFLLGLDALALGGKQRLFLSLPDIEALVQQYKDPSDPTRVCWETFEDDVKQGQDLVGEPVMEIAPSRISDPQPMLVDRDWQAVRKPLRQLCEDAVEKVKQKISQMKILIKPVFRDYDRQNNGHVQRDQMKQALHSNGILLSDEELFALEDRYNNDMGFNYFCFLKDVEPENKKEPASHGGIEHDKLVAKHPATRPEKNIIHILTKIKEEAIRKKIKLADFFHESGSQFISTCDFQRALAHCGFELKEPEIETLLEVFASKHGNDCIDYKRFCNVIGEPTVHLCLDKSLLETIERTSRSCRKNFLNFDERNVMAIAVQKLSKRLDLQTNLPEILREFDDDNSGTVSESQFLKALTLRGMYNLISSREFGVICKAFSFESGNRDEIDYRSFLKALDVLYATDKYNPF